MTNLWQQASNTSPFVCVYESYPILVSPVFQDLFQFPFIYQGQNHLNQHSQSCTVHLGCLVFPSHRRKRVRQQRQRKLERSANQREGLYNMHIVSSKINERICHIPNLRLSLLNFSGCLHSNSSTRVDYEGVGNGYDLERLVPIMIPKWDDPASIAITSPLLTRLTF